MPSLSPPPPPPPPPANISLPLSQPHTLSPRSIAPHATHPADAALVSHILLLLALLFLLAVLLRLPRALALFGGVSREWAAGHVFWYDKSVAAVAPSRRTRRGRRGTVSNNNNGGGNSEEKEQSGGVPRARPYPALHFPPHIASCPAPLRPLLAPLRARLPFLAHAGGGAGMGMGQALVLAVYFYAWVYAALFRSNVFTDPARTGWIAAAQVPVVFALAGKNGVGWLGGWGYEKLNFIHRFVGRIIVLAANIHSLHYFYFWSINGTFRHFIEDPSNTWGMVALVAVNVIFLFSVQSVRDSAYNLFLASHILGFLLILPAMYLHKPSLLPYILLAFFFLSLDHLLRLFKSRYTSAYLTPLPALEMTRVEIPALNAGWRAGQHVRLRVLAPRAAGMGWGRCLEVHPFTIANVARKEGGEGMVLMCKRAGGWTRGLYEVAKAGAASSSASSSALALEAGCGASEKGTGTGMGTGMGAGAGLGREVKVIVEGPYGGPGHVNFASFSAAVFVVGGSGVTYALAAIEDLVRKDLKGESRVKVVELVWIVADPACLAPLLPAFTKLITQSVYTPLRVSVFYTRAPIGKQPAFFDAVEASPFASPTSSPTSASSPASPFSPSAPAQASGSAPAYTSAPLAPVAEAMTPSNSYNNREQAGEHDAYAIAYAPSEHSQNQNQHEFATFSRPGRAEPASASAPAPGRRPRPRSQTVGALPPSAAALMQGQMQAHHLQPQPQQPGKASGSGSGSGPQRQDSSASARTLVGRENSTKSMHYRSASHSKRAETQAQLQSQSPSPSQPTLPRGLTLAAGRPLLAKFLEHALQRAVTLSHGNFKDIADGGNGNGNGGGGRLTGMVVGVCGPGGLADDVVAAVGGLDAGRRERVGGVEVCEEVFGW